MSAPLSERLVLDFDGYLAEQDQETKSRWEAQKSYQLPADNERSKKRIGAMAVVAAETGIDRAVVADEWDRLRAGYAVQNGWDDAKDDDDKVFAKIAEKKTKERDERHLLDGLDDPKAPDYDAKAKASLRWMASDAAYRGKPYAEALSAWQQASASKPGYDQARFSGYEEVARQNHEAMAEMLGKVKPIATTAFDRIAQARGVKEGEGDIAPFALFRGLTPQEKDLAFRVMKDEAGETGKGRTQAFMEAVGRGFENLGVGGFSASFGQALANRKFRVGDQVTEKTALAEVQKDQVAEALQRRGGVMDGAGEDMGRSVERMTRGRKLTADEAKQWNAQLEESSEDLDTFERMRKFGQNEIDPTKAGGTVFRHVVIPFADSVAIMSSLAIPGAWAPALELNARSYQNDEYARLREMDMERKEAYDLSAVTGYAQAALDKAQLGILLKGAPMVNRVIQRAALGGSTIARYGLNTAATLVPETLIELTQDQIIPALVQDNLASDPKFDVKWAGVWKDVAKAIPETAAGMLLLSGMGGIAQTRGQASFVRELGSSAAAMRARGYTMDQAREIQAAPEEVRGELLAQYLPTKAPVGEERAALVSGVATLAREEAETFAEKQRAEVIATSEALDYAARVTRKGDGWEVTTESGKTILADSAEAARRIREDLRQVGSQAEADALVAAVDDYVGRREDAEVELTGEEVATNERGELVATNVKGEARLVEDEKTLDALHEEARQLGLASGNGPMMVAVNGSNTVWKKKVADGAREIARRITLNRSASSYLTFIHEATEADFRAAVLAGAITEQEAGMAVSAVAVAFDPANSRDEQERAFRERVQKVARGEGSETELRETISELAVANEIGRRKDGGRMPVGAVTAALDAALRGTINAKEARGLSRFRAFLRAAKQYFRAVLGTVAALKRSGKAEEFGAFLDKIQGISEQSRYDAALSEELVDYVEPTAEEQAAGIAFSTSRAKPADTSRMVTGADGTTVVGPTTFSISAFHGTPHKVDRFSTDKIGTGEGAQVYGWGLYFAENEKVAKEYRDALSAELGDDDGLRVRPGGPAAQSALDRLKAAGGDYGKAYDSIQEELFSGPRITTDIYRDSKQLQEWDKRGLKLQESGNTYTVKLDVEPEDLLDWDQPLSAQSEKVKAALHEWMLAHREDHANLPGAEIYRRAGVTLQGKEGDKAASDQLKRAGIPGLRYLDQGSRGTRNWMWEQDPTSKEFVVSDDSNVYNAGEVRRFKTQAEAEQFIRESGTYNYVIFDESRIRITAENGQPVTMAEAMQEKAAPAFSLSSGAQLEAIRARLDNALAKDPAKRRELAREANQKLQKLQFDWEGRIADPRSKASLDKEEKFREAARAEELELELLGNLTPEAQAALAHGATKLEDRPLIAAMLRDHGRLMSKTTAQRRGRELGGEYDGATWLPPRWYAKTGGIAPDAMAQVLYDAGALNVPGGIPKADDLWQALEREIKSHRAESAAFDAAAKAAGETRARALTLASGEAASWRMQADTAQGRDQSSKARLLRSLRTLDAIVAVMPFEIRGKMGAWPTALASLETDEARVEEIGRRIERLSGLVERHLKAEYELERKKLFKRAKPLQDKAGKKPVGKAGADIHDLFSVLQKAVEWTPEETAKHIAGLEAGIASGDLTPDQEAHAIQEAALVDLFGDWRHADANRRVMAVEEATRVFEDGYLTFQEEKKKKSERRATRRDVLKEDTGKPESTEPERREKAAKDNGLLGGWKDSILGLLSFEQLSGWVFGDQSTEARRLADMEREASYQSTDEIHGLQDEISDTFTKLAGGQYKGEQLHWKMAQPSIGNLSELEAISATLMWRQPDGRRHMEGSRDENNQVTSGWSYDQAFIDAIEAALSDEAKAVRAMIATRYAGEYEGLNKVYRDLNGINLPHNPFYSPLTVKPQNAPAGQMADPLTGGIASGARTPGALKSRGTATAEPEFRDAIQTLIAHSKQMAHWKAYAPVTSEARALLGNREVGNSVEASSGKEAATLLRGWIDFFEQGGTRDASAHLALNKKISRATSRAASIAIVGRISTLAIQATQLGAAIAEMPTLDYLSRLGKLFTGNLGWEKSLDSPYVQRRIYQMGPVVRAAMEGLRADKPNQLRRQVQRIGWLVNGADGLFTAGTFAMVYDYQFTQAKTLGLDDASAAKVATKAAERSTDRIAQPVRTGARSLFENTATNPFVRIGWAFASEPRKNLALMAYSFAQRDAATKARAVAYVVIFNSILGAMIRAAVRDMRDPDDDEPFDDKHWGLKRMAIAAATEPLQGLPVFGRMAQGLVNKAAGVWMPEGDLLSGAGRAVSAVGDIPELLAGEVETEDALRDMEAILSGIGIANSNLAAMASISHMARDLYGIADNLSDTPEERVKKIKANAAARRKAAKEARESR